MIKTLKQSRKLIIAAHPDDEVFGCSSLLQNSSILLVTDAEDSNFIARKRILFSFAKDMYIPVYTLSLPACKLDTLGVQAVHNALHEALQGRYFDYVISHSTDDYHQDHAIIAKAVDIEFRPYRSKIKGLLEFQIDTANRFKPDIAIESNTELIKEYRNYVNPEFYKTQVDYKRYIGSLYDCGFADSFRIKFLR